MTRHTATTEAITVAEAARETTLSGWACNVCNKFWHGNRAEHMARYCCTKKRACDDCGADSEKHMVVCRSCRERRAETRFRARERRPWDASMMLYDETTDRYFRDPDDLDDHYECMGLRASDRRVLLATEQVPRSFVLSEHMQDYLAEDAEPPDSREVDAVIAAWIEQHRPWCYMPSKYAWDGTVNDSNNSGQSGGSADRQPE